MRRLALILALIVAPALHAQGPGPDGPPGPGRGRGPGGPPMRGGPQFGPRMRMDAGPGGDIGSFLLAHTAELQLTDQQVTRLAALTRRAADRRHAAMRAMDSLAARGRRPDSLRRRAMAPPPELRAQADRLRDQRHADLREALGVLTLDQQARAWDLRR